MVASALEAKVIQIGEKYAHRIHSVIDKLGEKGLQIANAIPSCGAGWTMLSFQANGTVQPCNMMESEWVLGNFKEDPNLDFLSLDNPLYAAFSSINLSAENGNRKECINCQYNDFCGKCIKRIFMANKKRLVQGKDMCPILKKTDISKELLLKKTKNG